MRMWQIHAVAAARGDLATFAASASEEAGVLLSGWFLNSARGLWGQSARLRHSKRVAAQLCGR